MIGIEETVVIVAKFHILELDRIEKTKQQAQTSRATLENMPKIGSFFTVRDANALRFEDEPLIEFQI